MLRFLRNAGAHDLSPSEKLCPKCQSSLHFNLSACPTCNYSPWSWRMNTRFLLMTLLLAILGIILIYPLVKANDKSYRKPMVAPTPEQYEK